jgi:hypothetical protein
LASIFQTAVGAINPADYALIVQDIGWIAVEGAQSYMYNSWDVTAAPAAVRLNPASSTTQVAQMVTLTAMVQGANDLTGYTFKWTNTENGGDLLQVGPGSQSTSKSSPSFCSLVSQPASSAQVNYLASTSGVTDTITVDVFPPGVKCTTTTAGCVCPVGTSLGAAHATVAVNGNPITLATSTGVSCTFGSVKLVPMVSTAPPTLAQHFEGGAGSCSDGTPMPGVEIIWGGQTANVGAGPGSYVSPDTAPSVDMTTDPGGANSPAPIAQVAMTANTQLTWAGGRGTYYGASSTGTVPSSMVTVNVTQFGPNSGDQIAGNFKAILIRYPSQVRPLTTMAVEGSFTFPHP